MFGIGACMDLEHLEKVKGIKVLDHCPGKVLDWAMTFSMHGAPYVEPAFASANPQSGGEIHGLGYAASKEHAAIIDEKEGVGFYHVVNVVTIHLYDGRQVTGNIYTAKIQNEPTTPSDRYLKILIDGAIAAKLDEGYIDKLK